MGANFDPFPKDVMIFMQCARNRQKIMRIHAGLQVAVLLHIVATNFKHPKHKYYTLYFLRLPKPVPEQAMEPCFERIICNLHCFKP